MNRGAGAQVEVLQWSASGKPMVLLPGLGNTAHVFEDFAPRLSEGHRIIAITPRGFGASSPAPAAGALDTLLADVAAVLDTLGIQQATLVGSSIGGDVAAHFALLHPDRVNAIISLDGLFDRRPDKQLDQPHFVLPDPPQPLGRDSVSDSAYGAYWLRVWGYRIPQREIRFTNVFDAGGRWLSRRDNSQAGMGLIQSLTPPDFERLRIPVLGLFPRADSLHYDYPFWNDLTGAARASVDTVQWWMVYANRMNQDSIHRMIPQLEVVNIPRSSHLIFLMTPVESAQAIREFLARHEL